MERRIIHLNVADFAVAVERLTDARLRGRPVIVANQGLSRALVYDMSEEAYRSGVRKGMLAQRAKRICRDAVVTPPRPLRYEQAMRLYRKTTLPFTPLIESGETDGHIFLDVTATGKLFGPPMDIAWKIRKRMRRESGIDPIWAVAPNKLVAKAATRMVKPDGEYIVAGGEETDFIAPMPLNLLPGIEIDDLRRFADFNLTRAGEAAALSMAQLHTAFGNRARFLHDTVRGLDDSPVSAIGDQPPTIRINRLLDTDTNDGRLLSAALYGMVERAGKKLRGRRLTARRIAVRVTFSDGLQRIRQRKADPPTADDPRLFDIALSAFHLAWNRRVRVRSLRLMCDRLVFPPSQLPLFPEETAASEKRSGLMSAIDTIRERFGDDAIRIGRTPAA